MSPRTDASTERYDSQGLESGHIVNHCLKNRAGSVEVCDLAADDAGVNFARDYKHMSSVCWFRCTTSIRSQRRSGDQSRQMSSGMCCKKSEAHAPTHIRPHAGFPANYPRKKSSPSDCVLGRHCQHGTPSLEIKHG
jgi:hypothetical protein